MTEWSAVAIAAFTGVLAVIAMIQARFLKLTHDAYRLMSRPVVFAWPRDKTEAPGIRVENAGKGAAWNGDVVVTGNVSGNQTKYSFTRLYEQTRYEYPIEGQPQFSYDRTRDTRMKIEISYYDEDKRGRKYDWEGEFELPNAWLNRSAGT